MPWAGYSYSEEYIYEQTPNAATDARNWVMSNLLPNNSGLTVEAVDYSYTTIKDPSDDLTVTITNVNAIDGGYIFQNIDDWLGSDSVAIERRISVDSIPLEYWGQGEIKTSGSGLIEGESVVYQYRYDPCHNPQASPECEGYVAPDLVSSTDQNIYNALEDENVVIEQTDPQYTDAEEDSESNEDDNRKKRAALALNAGAVATRIAQDQMLAAMNAVVNITAYYDKQIVGGVYKDSTTLVDARLPDSKNGLRNGLAQQILHNQMVMEQYK